MNTSFDAQKLERLRQVDGVLRKEIRGQNQVLPRVVSVVRRGELSLTKKQILECIFEGKSDKEISDALKIGAATVHTHMAHLFKRLGVHSRNELVTKFLQP